jgi:hypothetical protein
VDRLLQANVSEKRVASIFRTEVTSWDSMVAVLSSEDGVSTLLGNVGF